MDLKQDVVIGVCNPELKQTLKSQHIRAENVLVTLADDGLPELLYSLKHNNLDDRCYRFLGKLLTINHFEKSLYFSNQNIDPLSTNSVSYENLIIAVGLKREQSDIHQDQEFLKALLGLQLATRIQNIVFFSMMKPISDRINCKVWHWYETLYVAKLNRIPLPPALGVSQEPFPKFLFLYCL